MPLKSKAAIESKTATIPKMELESIVLLTSLYKLVKKNIPAVSFHAYTDSEIALAWVRNGDCDNAVVRRRKVKVILPMLPAEAKCLRLSSTIKTHLPTAAHPVRGRNTHP